MDGSHSVAHDADVTKELEPESHATKRRGYYRCSTSKGCSAKKQVERCRTDASMLVITYTCSHNHPGPELPTNLTQEPKETQIQLTEDHAISPKKEPEQKEEQDSLINSHDEDTNEDSPFSNSQEIVITQEENHSLTENLETTYDSPGVLINQEPPSYSHVITFSTPKTEENDFYDELEELPTYSSSLMRSNFFEERTLVHPS